MLGEGKERESGRKVSGLRRESRGLHSGKEAGLLLLLTSSAPLTSGQAGWGNNIMGKGAWGVGCGCGGGEGERGRGQDRGSLEGGK